MPKRLSNIMADLPSRFWSKVQKTDSCWLWTAAVNQHGYGKFRWFGKSDRAHRVGYILTHGELPDGVCVLHKCDNPRCVRPDHMFLGDRVDNAKDRQRKRRAPHGEGASWSRFTAEQIRAIRADPRSGSQIAKDYGTRQQTIWSIKTRQNWKYLD